MTSWTRRTARALLAVLAFAVPGASAATGSNLPGGGYPAPACGEVTPRARSEMRTGYPAPACGERPQIPERPEKFETEQAIVEYNVQVETYNASMERFVACVQEYVTNADADVRRIRKLMREAIDRVNR